MAQNNIPSSIPILKKAEENNSAIATQTLEVLTSIKELLAGSGMNKVSKNAVSKSKTEKKETSEDLGNTLKEKIKEGYKEAAEKTKEGVKEFGKEAFNTALGPLRLITAPLEKLFKVDFAELTGKALLAPVKGIGKLINFSMGHLKNFYEGSVLGGNKAAERATTLARAAGLMGGKKVKDDAEKKFRITDNPSKTDLARTEAGQATLFMLSNKDREKKEGGLGKEIFGGLLSGGMSSILGLLFKILPIAAIAGGIIMMIFDGIKGSLLAGKWGTTKISAIIGAVLGGTSSGIQGAFANMGKWALIGAGVGTLIVPGLGTLIGGLAGALLGGILGFFGGEKLAKAFDAIGKWFGDRITDVKAFIKDPSKILPALGKAIINGMIFAIQSVWGMFTLGRDLIFRLQAAIFSPVLNLFDFIGDYIDLFIQKGPEAFVIMGDKTKMSKFRSENEDKRMKNVNEEYNKKVKDINSQNILQAEKDLLIKSAQADRDQQLDRLTKAKKDIVGMANGGIISKEGFFYGAEGNKPELVIPMSKVEKGFDNPMMQSLLQSMTNKSRGKDLSQEIVIAIKEQTKVLMEKQFANIVQNNLSNPISFDKMRMSMSYGDSD